MILLQEALLLKYVAYTLLIIGAKLYWCLEKLLSYIIGRIFEENQILQAMKQGVICRSS